MKFQEATGKEVVRISSNGFSANGILHTLPLIGKYLYVPRGPIVGTKNQESRIKNGMQMLLEKAGEKKVSFYKSDWFENLCLGPHVGSTQEIDPDSFKLIKVAGSYWRGDEKNKMLTRIYGVAFENKDKLEKHLSMLEESKKRDHRKLGKELDSSSIDKCFSSLSLFSKATP